MKELDVTKINKGVLDTLTLWAQGHLRRRMHCDMRNSENDSSQRMLNALEPGTVLPVHRHRFSSETCIILRGKAVEIFYDYAGYETERILMDADGECRGCDIPMGTWHRIESLESGTVIFEAKDGPYAPLTEEDILNI
ncbi:MAG: WbuC family cupin fold metalloprotein [Clostridia bacterium]|nr:WbuC family cupin fold metalloprotein [Clostridia bacterium]